VDDVEFFRHVDGEAEEYLAVWHADVQCVRPDLPGGKTYGGLIGVRTGCGNHGLDWLAPWAEYRTKVEEAID
jgi:hypothetical protein